MDSDGVVEQRIKRSPTGVVAEVHLQVNQSVEGFKMGKTMHLYKDLRAENPNMSRKQRDFRTTGVIVKIEEPWFSGLKQDQASVRESVANGLLGLICRDRSISPQDVDAAHTNIALLTEAGPKRLTDAIILYDSVYGGLRLTENLFVEIGRYVEQLGRAADLAGEDAIVAESTTEKLTKWVSTLGEGTAGGQTAASVPDGWFQVYPPGKHG